MKSKPTSKIFFFLLLFSLDFIIFYPTFFIFFAADDFFVLYQTQIKNFFDFWKLLLPHPEVVYYRPLGIQLYFWFLQLISGLNPLPFHLFSFFFHLFNTFLVYRLAEKLSRDKKIAFATAFFWSLSAIHFLSLAWAVNFSFILVTFFYFLTLIFWLERKRNLALFTFFLGVFSNELMLTLPIFLMLYEWLILKNKFKQMLLKILPFFLMMAFYLLIRSIFPGKYEGVYRWEFNKQILSTLRWYWLWSLGWAETMKDQMINFYSIRDEFYVSFFKETLIFINGLSVVMTVFILLPLVVLFSGKLKITIILFKKYFKLLFLGLLLFLLSLLPVLFTPNHIYPHYLTIASFGLYFSLVFFYFKVFQLTRRPRLLSYFFLLLWSISWILVSYTTVRLNMRVHWVQRHAAIAKESVEQFKAKLPECQDKILLIVSQQKERRLSLAEDKAVKAYFGQDWQVYYADDIQWQRLVEKSRGDESGGRKDYNTNRPEICSL